MWVLPVIVLHEEAEVDENKGWRTDNTTAAVHEDSLLFVLDHFIQFQGSLEELIIQHAVVIITNWVVHDLFDSMRSIELFQPACINRP